MSRYGLDPGPSHAPGRNFEFWVDANGQPGSPPRGFRNLYLGDRLALFFTLTPPALLKVKAAGLDAHVELGRLKA
jgi:hypothetical protein